MKIRWFYVWLAMVCLIIGLHLIAPKYYHYDCFDAIYFFSIGLIARSLTTNK